MKTPQRWMSLSIALLLIATSAGVGLFFDDVVRGALAVDAVAAHAHVLTVGLVWGAAAMAALLVTVVVRSHFVDGRGISRTRRAARATRFTIGLVVATLLTLRVGAPYFLEAVFDDALGTLPDHWGSVQDVDLALYRGRYTAHGLVVLERNADTDHAVLALKRTEVELDWDRLLDGEIDAVVALTGPRIAIVKTKTTLQTGESPALRKLLLDFVPLDISRFTVDGGRFLFVDETASPRVELDLRDIHARASGLSTRPHVEDRTKPGALPAHVEARASVLGQAPLTVELDLDAFATEPTFDFAMQMDQLPLTALNDVTQAYAGFDYEAGTLAFSSELAAANGALEGYAKPVLADPDVLDTDGNDEDDGILEVSWNAFVGAVSLLLENHTTDTVATRIPLEGRFDQPDVGVIATVLNLLGHAFVDTINANVEGSISIEDVLAREAS